MQTRFDMSAKGVFWRCSFAVGSRHFVNSSTMIIMEIILDVMIHHRTHGLFSRASGIGATYGSGGRGAGGNCMRRGGGCCVLSAAKE